MKYSVTCMDVSCNNLTRHIVDADNEIDAIYKSGKADINKGELDGLETIEQAKAHLFNEGKLISVIRFD